MTQKIVTSVVVNNNLAQNLAVVQGYDELKQELIINLYEAAPTNSVTFLSKHALQIKVNKDEQEEVERDSSEV